MRDLFPDLDGSGVTPNGATGRAVRGTSFFNNAEPQFFQPPTSGVAANGLPIYSWDQAAAQLTRESSGWGAGETITYAFRTSAPSMPEGTGGFSRFNAAQILAAEEALRLWSDVADIHFTRVGAGTSGAGAFSNSATILFGNYSTGMQDASAFAYFPGSSAPLNVAGDVWVNATISDNVNPVFGQFGPHVLVHEIGHAIGLSHPGDYDGGSPVYPDNATYWQDARMFTVMSYFGSGGVGGNLDLFSAGPQLHDIAAAQLLYGPNMTTRTGNTVYGFHSNTGHQHTTIGSASQSAVFAIWDAGGVDTIDLSGYTTPSEIDLREEAFSSAGPDSDSPTGVSVGNIAIARGAVIESAIGGAGADTIIGNAINNRLTGNGGADHLSGGAGEDTLIGGASGDVLAGGAGRDSATYLASASAVQISANGDAGVGGDAAGDRLGSIENITGSAFNDTITGSAVANILMGREGNDLLIGMAGADTLSGGSGRDTFVFREGLGATSDKITDFSSAFDTIQLDHTVFSGLMEGVLGADAFHVGGRAVDVGDRILYNAGNGALLFDVDGVGGEASIRFAVLTSGLDLTYADFIVI